VKKRKLVSVSLFSAVAQQKSQPHRMPE